MEIMRKEKAFNGNDVRLTYDRDRIMGKYRVDFQRKGEHGWRYACSFDTAGEGHAYFDKMIKGGKR